MEQPEVTDQSLVTVLRHIATARHGAGVGRTAWNVLDDGVTEMSVTKMIEEDCPLQESRLAKRALYPSTRR